MKNKELQDKLKHEESLNAEWRRRAQEAEQKAQEAIKTRNEVQANFSDLKRRLHNAELANERLRGYLNRVQEDDMVREELITIGEPDGEQRLVPKRKPTHFEGPETAYMDTRAQSEMYGMTPSERHKQRKHWIEY